MKISKFIKTIRKSGTSLAINIPLEVIRLMELKEGEIVEIEIKKLKKGK